MVNGWDLAAKLNWAKIRFVFIVRVLATLVKQTVLGGYGIIRGFIAGIVHSFYLFFLTMGRSFKGIGNEAINDLNMEYGLLLAAIARSKRMTDLDILRVKTALGEEAKKLSALPADPSKVEIVLPDLQPVVPGQAPLPVVWPTAPTEVPAPIEAPPKE